MARSWVHALKTMVDVPRDLNETACGRSVARWRRRRALLIEQDERFASAARERVRVRQRIASCDEAISSLEAT